MDENRKSVEPGEKPRLRWYQFSLRTLLIVVTLAGCGFGWLGKKIRDARQQQAAVAAIRELGGDVGYDYQTGERRGPAAEPFGPRWLREILGDNFFSEATEVEILGIDDDRCAKLKDALEALPHLKKLKICAPGITAVGLSNFAGLTQLEELQLLEGSITEAGAQQLKGLSGLRHLEGQLSDAALSELKKALPDCEIDNY